MRLAGTAATRFTLSPVASRPALPHPPQFVYHERAGLHSTACPTSASRTTCATRAGAATSPPAAIDGAAGGAACGDLVRFSVAVEGDRVADAGFEAAGCGATIAAASAAVELVRGAPLLDAARIGSAAVAAELGGLSAGKLHAADLAADALARRARRRRARRRRRAGAPGRTLVAMSGGVDCAVAALLRRRRGRRRHARAVARPGERRRALVLLGRRRARRPRARAPPGPAAPHARPARRVPRGRRRAVARRARRRARRRTRACAATATSASTRCSTSPTALGAATLATGHYARRSPDGLLRLAADPAKDQTYMLAGAGAARRSRACASRSAS